MLLERAILLLYHFYIVNHAFPFRVASFLMRRLAYDTLILGPAGDKILHWIFLIVII